MYSALMLYRFSGATFGVEHSVFTWQRGDESALGDWEKAEIRPL